MTEEEAAAAKAEADARAAEEAKAAEAAAKAKQEEDARKAEESRRAAAASGGMNGMSEEQWQALEKQYGIPRNQIILQATIAKSMMDAGPQARLLEKEAMRDAKDGIPDFNFYESDVKKALDALPAADRQNPDRIKSLYYEVKGRKVTEGKFPPDDSTPRRRVSSGLGSGSNDQTKNQQDTLPDFGKGDDAHDAQEVFEKFGFKDKKEWDSMQSREVPLPDESKWQPKFR